MLFRIQSFKQAAFWSTALNAFSQGLALIFSIMMAGVFGVQASTDILYYCLGIFALLSGILQSASISVLIPETMRRRHQMGEADAMAFINRFLVVLWVPILLLTIGLLWKPIGALTLLSRFSPQILAENSRLIFWLVLSFPLQLMAQLLLNILVSYRYLTLPATLSCISRVINILFVWLFHRKWGVESFAIGLVVGCAIQLIVNIILMQRVIRWRFLAWQTHIERQTYQNIAWVELGTLAGIVASYLPLFLFSGLSAGVLTMLNYARRMSAMPTELLSSQISSVTAIKFNEQVAHLDYNGLRLSFDRIQRLLILILTPLAFVLALAGRALVEILFGRGAFGVDAVTETAWLFSVLILALPLEAVNSVVARMNIARQEVAFGTRWQILGNVLYAMLVFWLVKQFGPMGLPVGTLVFYILYLLLLARPFSTRFTPATLWPTMQHMVWTVVACSATAAVACVGEACLLPDGVKSWLSGLVLSGLFTIVYAGVLRYFPPDRQGRDEALDLTRAAVRRVADWIELPRRMKGCTRE